MNGEKPKLLKGEIIAPEESSREVTAEPEYTPVPRRFSLLAELHAYADRRVKEQETKLKHAIADNIEATTRIANVSKDWAIAEEQLQPENIERMKETVRLQVETEHERALLELEQIKTIRGLEDLDRQAREMETRERIAKSRVNMDRLERKLHEKEEDLEEMIAAAEQEIQDIMDAFTKKRKAAHDAGIELSEAEEDEFSRRLQSARDRRDSLRERKRKQEEDQA